MDAVGTAIMMGNAPTNIKTAKSISARLCEACEKQKSMVKTMRGKVEALMKSATWVFIVEQATRIAAASVGSDATQKCAAGMLARHVRRSHMYTLGVWESTA